MIAPLMGSSGLRPYLLWGCGSVLKRFRRLTGAEWHDMLSSGMRKTLLTTILLAVVYLAQAQLTVQGDSLISLRGTRIQLSKLGFPEQIDSLLAENIHIHFTRQSDGKDIRLTSGGVRFTKRDKKVVRWNATSTSDELQMEVFVSMGSQGYMTYLVKAIALQDLDLKDITLHIPLQPERAKFMAGLGWRNGPSSAWIGTENGGIQYSFRPGAWNNEGKGGTTVVIKGKSMLVNNYSGPRHLQKGDSLSYSFDLVSLWGHK
jgi:Family of unknown function (DUF6067)